MRHLEVIRLPKSAGKLFRVGVGSKLKPAPCRRIRCFDQIETLLAQPNDIDDVVIADASRRCARACSNKNSVSNSLSFDDLLANLARALF